MDSLVQASDWQLEECDVWVLGGGISGLTTALVLQSLQLKVAIFSEHLTLQSAKQAALPAIATSYAMASAYPHNLKVSDLERISQTSQGVFGQLEKDQNSGVTRYRIFEVFEAEPQEAALSGQRMNFQTFDGSPAALRKTVYPPIRPGAKHLWGWQFDSYFADMPIYLPFLWNRFFQNGGCVRHAKVDVGSILNNANCKPLVNCLGLGAIEAFNDRTNAVIVRGRQVLVPNAKMVTDSDGVPLAYNYTPTADVFARGDGSPEYVHFFPRAADWVLGQTREPGRLDPDGNWVGDAVSGAEIKIGTTTVPAAIIELNDAILRSWTNLSIDRTNLVAREGLRYYRDPGVRLESETINGIQIVHNYGHGGSGITMSWGCAIDAARLLNR